MGLWFGNGGFRVFYRIFIVFYRLLTAFFNFFICFGKSFIGQWYNHMGKWPVRDDLYCLFLLPMKDTANCQSRCVTRRVCRSSVPALASSSWCSRHSGIFFVGLGIGSVFSVFFRFFSTLT